MVKPESDVARKIDKLLESLSAFRVLCKQLDLMASGLESAAQELEANHVATAPLLVKSEDVEKTNAPPAQDRAE